MTTRRIPPWIVLFSAFALLAAQLLLAMHEIEHVHHADPVSCEICLTGSGLGAGLVHATPAPLLAHAYAHCIEVFYRQSIVADAYRSHHPRAPPVC